MCPVWETRSEAGREGQARWQGVLRSSACVRLRLAWGKGRNIKNRFTQHDNASQILRKASLDVCWGRIEVGDRGKGECVAERPSKHCNPALLSVSANSREVILLDEFVDESSQMIALSIEECGLLLVASVVEDINLCCCVRS